MNKTRDLYSVGELIVIGTDHAEVDQSVQHRREDSKGVPGNVNLAQSLEIDDFARQCGELVAHDTELFQLLQLADYIGQLFQ